MKLTVEDRSNYFRGLLLLARKDRKIAAGEVTMMKRIGKSLGFEEAFCDNAILEILENEYIADTPPSFSSHDIAMMFLKDGLSLAFADNEVHPAEELWVRTTAEVNGLDPDIVLRELEAVRRRIGLPVRLEVECL